MNQHLLFLFLILLLPSLVLGQVETLDDTFSNPTQLTDKEMDDAKNFVHQGKKDRAMEEGCKNKKAQGCKQEDEGMPLERMIGMAYTTIGMISSGGGGPSLNKKPTAEAQNDAAAKGPGTKVEKEKQTDYCMIAATAYEAVSGFLQKDLQSKADNQAAGAGDAQLQALISLRETHLARKKTANYQRTIYAAVTLCYAGMATMGGVATDTNLVLKMGGAAALTGLYWKKVNKHKDAAGAVQKVINAMDKAGRNCDPWTKSACFCSEPTSKTVYPAQYQEVCVLNNGDFDVPKVALGCAAVTGDNKLQYDESCTCKQTNTCLKTNFAGFNANLRTGTNFMNEANKTFDLLNTGNFDEGQLERASVNASALANKIKLKPDEKLKDPSLTLEQKEMAKALSEFMPAQVANLAATSSPSSYRGGVNDSSIGAAALNKLPPALKNDLAKSISVSYKKGRGNTSYSSDEPEFILPKFPGQGEEAKSNIEVLTFAEQAISKADVSNAPETPIFDIISNRYRRSGWGKLERIEK